MWISVAKLIPSISKNRRYKIEIVAVICPDTRSVEYIDDRHADITVILRSHIFQ